MAQLKDTIVKGSLATTDKVSAAYLNNITLEGTGIAGKDNGSSDATTRYQPATWTFDGGITPVDGDIVCMRVPVVGHDYGTWITTDNGNTWHVGVYCSSSRFTTHFAVGVAVLFRFDAKGTASVYPRGGGMARATETGVWRMLNFYDSGNTNDSAGYMRSWGSETLHKMKTALYRYMMIFDAGDNTYYIPACATSNSTGTAKTTITTQAINIFGPMYYYNQTGTVNADASVRSDYIFWTYRFALSYSFNTGSTLTTGKDVYLVVTPETSSPRLGKLRNPGATGANASAQATGENAGPITQILPTEEDGYVYILLGKAYSTANINLYMVHPAFCYKNGGICEYSGEALATTTSNGLMSSSDKIVLNALGFIQPANGVSF